MQYNKCRKRESIQSMDGLWEFSLRENFLNSDLMAVPGCWDASFNFLRHRGRVYYRRKLAVSEIGLYRLVFDGAANCAKIYVDGNQVCEHNGAHTRFYTEVFELTDGEHEVVVEVDNSFGNHNALMEEKCGWYCFGGLFRSVWLERLNDIHIETACIDFPDITPDRAMVNICAEIMNLSKRAHSNILKLFVNGIVAGEVSFELEGGQSKEVEFSINIDNPELWSPENPYLYDMRLTAGTGEYRTRFGIREVECRNGKIYLNGEELCIKGINHHDYQPGSGYTQTLAQLKYDLDIIKDLGCNLIRTSHYPKDEMFYDLCDEMGLLVWSEATGWQNTPGMMLTPAFEQQCMQCIDEMVKEQYNHPSVIIWGLLNEVRSEYEEVRPLISRLINRFRELDPTRPITFATNRLLHNKDKMLDLVDIISPNLYVGWYRDFYGDMDEAAYFNKILEWFDQTGLSDKPVLIGEFGAGAISGFHSFAKERWSEESQEDLLRDSLDVFTKHPRCAGAVLWLFADTACCETEELHRPYSHNCKGIVDAHRNPKKAYNIVKAYFKNKENLKMRNSQHEHHDYRKNSFNVNSCLLVTNQP